MKIQNIKIFNIQYLIFSLFFVSCLLYLVAPVFAENVEQGQNLNLSQDITKQMDIAGVQTGLGARDPRETAARVINVSLTILGIIFLAYVVYAGYLWMTAGGEEEKVSEAKNHLRNGLIGLVIILAALGIMLLVTTYLIRATKFEFYQPPPPYDIIK